MDRLPAHAWSTLNFDKNGSDFLLFLVKKKKKKVENRKNLQIWKDAPKGVFYLWDESVWKKIRRISR